MTSADVCRAHGWGPGEVLEYARPGGRVVRYRIATVGDMVCSAVPLPDEVEVTLMIGEWPDRWRKVDPYPRPDMAPHVPPPRTVRVRIAVAVAPDGMWYATGMSGQDDDAARDDALHGYPPGSRVSWVGADVAVPQEETVEGRVV